jgi:hypothetical protein
MFMLAIGTWEMAAQKAHYHADAENRTWDCGIGAHYTRMCGKFVTCCLLPSPEVQTPRMTEPSVLQCFDDRVNFQSELVKQVRLGEDPTREGRDASIDIAAHRIKRHSKTGVKLADILEWVKATVPPRDLMVNFMNDMTCLLSD